MAYLHQQKRDGVWFLIDKSRKPSWIKLGKITRNKARQVLLRYQTERTYLRLGLEAPHLEIKFKELVSEYLEHIKPIKAARTVQLETDLLTYLEKTFGESLIHTITVADLEKYLSEKNYKPWTWRHIFNSVRMAFRLAVEKKYIQKNHLEKIRLPRLKKSTPKFVDPDLLDTLMEYMEGRTKFYFMLLKYTAMRPGEILKLKPSSIRKIKFKDQDGKIQEREIFVIPNPKGDLDRRVAIHSKILPLVKEAIKNLNPDDWLFAGKKEGEHQKSMKSALVRALRRATNEQEKLPKNERVNFNGITLYTFRHTVATDMLAKTGDLRAVQTVLGHTSSKTTEIYAHALEAAKLNAIEVL